MSKNNFPVLKVAKILDKVTLILTGLGIDKIEEREQLIVVGVGPSIGEVGLQLAIPKATVEVSAHAGSYLIAKSLQYEEEIWDYGPLGGLGMSLREPKKKSVYRRGELKVVEDELSGNPAATPIAVGDPVIRRGDFRAYASALLTEDATS